MSEDPSHIFFNDDIILWNEAQVHICSDTATKGINVFDTCRSYWSEELRQHQLLSLNRHLQRLLLSAQSLRIPHEYSQDYFSAGIEKLLNVLNSKEDLYIRFNIFFYKGGYSASPDKISVGTSIVAFPIPSCLPNTRSCVAICSKHTKLPGSTFSSQIKAGGLYLLGRLSRLEAAEANADEAILFDHNGYLCESPGANIFLVDKQGVLCTPSTSLDILNGVTRQIVLRIAEEVLRIPVKEGSFTKQNLFEAEEVFLTSTLDEIKMISKIGSQKLSNSSGIVNSIARSLYDDITGNKRFLKNDLSYISSSHI
jgi:branched-chain amino acid aminotransferase